MCQLHTPHYLLSALSGEGLYFGGVEVVVKHEDTFFISHYYHIAVVGPESAVVTHAKSPASHVLADYLQNLFLGARGALLDGI